MPLNTDTSGRVIASDADRTRLERGSRMQGRGGNRQRGPDMDLQRAFEAGTYRPLEGFTMRGGRLVRTPRTPAPGSVPTAPGAPGAPYTNTAQNQPDMRWAIDQLGARTEGDLGAGRAIEVAVGKLRELGIGEDAATRGNLAARGALGAMDYDSAIGATGAEGLALAANQTGREQRAAGVATDIALGREAQRDDLYRSILSGGEAAGRLGLGDRSLSLQQQAAADANARFAAEMQQQNELSRQAAAQSQQNALLQLLTSFGPTLDPFAAQSAITGIGTGSGTSGFRPYAPVGSTSMLDRARF